MNEGLIECVGGEGNRERDAWMGGQRERERERAESRERERNGEKGRGGEGRVEEWNRQRNEEEGRGELMMLSFIRKDSK